MNATWKVLSTGAADKQALKLCESVVLQLRLLVMDLVTRGPALPGWPHYGKLHGTVGDKRHCHLQRRRPTYVCCWEVIDKKRKIIEVYYVGTHEKAPY